MKILSRNSCAKITLLPGDTVTIMYEGKTVCVHEHFGKPLVFDEYVVFDGKIEGRRAIGGAMLACTP